MDQVSCPCGGIILADTEEWKVPLCYECYRFGGLEKQFAMMEKRLQAAERVCAILDDGLKMCVYGYSENPAEPIDHIEVNGPTAAELKEALEVWRGLPK